MKIDKSIITIFTIFVLILIISKMIINAMENNETTASEVLNKKDFNEQDAKDAILFIKNKYGVDMAKLIEKMLRLETAHFKSYQYKKTGSAGMEKGKWLNIPSNVKYVTLKDNHDGRIVQFIVWDSVKDFCVYLAEYIKRYNGNYARWNSTNPNIQQAYIIKVQSVKSRFV